MLPGYAQQLHYIGEDFIITAEFSQEAKIPLDAALTVSEILPGTEEYQLYHNRCIETLLAQSDTVTEEDLNLTFARYFDIHFTLDGQILEPEDSVSVQIQYAQPIAVEEDQNGTAVHFAENGIELLSATISGVQPLVEEEGSTDQQVDTFAFTQDTFSVVGTVLANARATPVTVWLDGTCGGLMAYDGSDNLRQTLNDRKLPETWKSPTKYAYVLKGWYDITNNQYYAPGAVIDTNVSNNAVFYADWIAADYSQGGENDYSVTTLDTSEFVTVHMFDYNALFNLYSADLSSQQANNSRHSETWTLVERGNVDLGGGATLDFLFRDHDGGGSLTHPNISDGSSIRNEPTGDQLNAITPGIYSDKLGEILFDPNVEAVGKEYLGTGNFLFQYMEDPTDEYYGYYFYNSFRNAATYNQQEQRFYVYDYLEYCQDTIGNNLDDTNADFLPLNHTQTPYGQIVYASQRNQNPADMVNFFYGMRADIHFYLPNDAGATDANGNYLNKSTTGDDMIFDFSGDDDVWVLVDGKLLLDIGGIHQVRGGRIDFSQGVVYTTRAGSDQYEVRTFAEILGEDNPILEGSHDLTILYLERGGSMSNCAMYFNLAPRYGLDLLKEDYVTGQAIPGVTFQVFNDETCATPAKLWPSHDAAKAEATPVNTFTTGEDGIAHMFGLVAGKTYYIKEIAAPKGYILHENLIRVTLNNHGTDISEVTVVRTDSSVKGFEVTSHLMNKESHLISMTVTNKQTEDQLTDFRVEKQWGENTYQEVPIQIYLLANGQRQGEPATLSVDNSWGHTWQNLPVEDANGQPIVYSAEELHVPGYTLEKVTESQLETDKINWVKVGALEDSAVFLLALDDSRALTGENGAFGVMELLNAQSAAAAQWQATAYRDGFRISNGGYYLAFDNNARRLYLTQGDDGNQIFYYDGSQLFAMSGNSRYYLGDWNNGITVSTSENSSKIYKKVVTLQGTTVLQFTNKAIPEEQQVPLVVQKYWEGNYTQLPDSLTVMLKKDGNTVATLELTAESNWQASIQGLDRELLASNGYTLEEVVPFGFSPKVSAIENISTDTWSWNSGQNGLVTGKTYVFVSNGAALADDNGTPKATTYYGEPTLNQQWLVVESTLSGGSKIQVLRNVGTGRYLRENKQNFYMVTYTDANCQVRLINSRLQYYPQSNGNGWAIVFGSNSLGASWGSNGGTALTIYQHEQTTAYQITVTNVYGTYVLPNTGGGGTTTLYVLGGALCMAAALMCLAERRRRKGGGKTSF